jgi:hypothetical protein
MTQVIRSEAPYFKKHEVQFFINHILKDKTEEKKNFNHIKGFKKW